MVATGESGLGPAELQIHRLISDRCTGKPALQARNFLTVVNQCVLQRLFRVVQCYFGLAELKRQLALAATPGLIHHIAAEY